MNKKVYWIVLKNAIIPKIREAKLRSIDLIDEMINRYDDDFIGYDYSYDKALDLYLLNRQIFEGDIKDRDKMKQDIIHLEQCYKLKQEV